MTPLIQFITLVSRQLFQTDFIIRSQQLLSAPLLTGEGSSPQALARGSWVQLPGAGSCHPELAEGPCRVGASLAVMAGAGSPQTPF